MNDWIVRALRPDEVEATVAMWRRSRLDALAWLEARMAHTLEDDRGFFRDRLMKHCSMQVVARDDAVLGLCAFQDGLIDQLFVDPRAQGLGVGSALVAWAKQASPSGLTLYTHVRNRAARAFYRRRGFVPAAFGVSPPPEREPDVRYVWRP